MHLKPIASRLFEEANNSPLALSSKSGSCASLKDHGSGTSSRAPSSPTDQMLSPVSRRLLSKKSYSTDEGDHKLKKSLSMNLSDISPIPFPAPHLDFIFGTSSKFRKEIINQLGWSYTQMSPDIDEKAIRTDDPIDLPIKIAEAKAAAIIEQLKNNDIMTEKLILTADQVVLFEQTIREKPLHDEEALQFLSSYSGKSVSTVSAI
eukprot:gene17090-19560_t